MKEILKKFSSLFSEWVSKLEESKQEEAIAKFKEASEIFSDIQKKSEENNEVDLKKFFESEEGKETLKKYADLFVSDSDTKWLLDQIKVLSWKIEELEKQKEKDDSVVSETLDKTIDRIEELESSVLNKRYSKID